VISSAQEKALHNHSVILIYRVQPKRRATVPHRSLTTSAYWYLWKGSSQPLQAFISHYL